MRRDRRRVVAPSPQLVPTSLWWLQPLALSFALVALGCTSEDPSISNGGSIHHAGDVVLVASPDDDTLVLVDATTLAERSRLEIEGAPTKLAAVGDAFVVGLAGRAAVAWVRGADVRYVEVPCGGTGAAIALSDDEALVACPHDDRLVRLRDGVFVEHVEAVGRPTALTRLGDRVYVGLSRRGVIEVRDASTLQVMRTQALETAPGFAAVQLDALVADGEGVVASYQRVDVDSDRSRDPSTGGYGSVTSGAPRLEPRLLAACGGRYARFDGTERVASGPSALAFDRGRRRLWVAHRQTGNVVLVACGGEGLSTPNDGEARVIASAFVGRGLEGLALDGEGGVFVDVAFDHAVAHVREEGAALVVEGPRTRTLGPTRWSPDGLRGRALFHDARDTQLTPSGVVTCASCHPGGGEDGLAWFLHTATVGPKLRRTPPAWAARPELAPYHWDGELESARELTLGTIRALLEGDGLLVDLDALVAYMEEVPAPPARPADDPAAAARGATTFEARCASCHPGGGSDGAAHAIVPASDDPAATLAAAQTPTLEAVRARPPYLHDGRAPTLRDVLTRADPEGRHGAADLDDAALNDLISYLETL
ncbi:MAG: c-type cytochrome [Sandaracinus sp.]|nr:c-type cytochrome [Sandaracinus sp.]